MTVGTLSKAQRNAWGKCMRLFQIFKAESSSVYALEIEAIPLSFDTSIRPFCLAAR
jgi:hypothetical protein